MKKNAKKPLALTSETLRRLHDRELTDAHGAGYVRTLANICTDGLNCSLGCWLVSFNGCSVVGC